MGSTFHVVNLTICGVSSRLQEPNKTFSNKETKLAKKRLLGQTQFSHHSLEPKAQIR
jgi:hypothetical protein